MLLSLLLIKFILIALKWIQMLIQITFLLILTSNTLTFSPITSISEKSSKLISTSLLINFCKILFDSFTSIPILLSIKSLMFTFNKLHKIHAWFKSGLVILLSQFDKVCLVTPIFSDSCSCV